MDGTASRHLSLQLLIIICGDREMERGKREGERRE